MSSVDLIAMVVKTKFSKLTKPSATMPAPASTLIGTMSRKACCRPGTPRCRLSTATARMIIREISAKNHFAAPCHRRDNPGPLEYGRRHQLIPLFSGAPALHRCAKPPLPHPGFRPPRCARMETACWYSV